MAGYIGTSGETPRATQTRDTFLCVGGETSFATGGYSVNYVDVFLNGVCLVPVTDYTSTSKTSIVLIQAASLNDTLEVTTKKIETMERKIDNLAEKIDGEVLEECKKMGGHIDFVEEVYDNVKHPLGYICKKIGYLTGSSEERYTLTDLQSGDDQLETDEEN